MALGIFIGFLIGCSVVWWYSIANSGERIISKKIAQVFNSLFDSENDSIRNNETAPEVTKPLNKKQSPEVKKEETTILSTDTIAEVDSSIIDNNLTEGEIEPLGNLIADSLFLDSIFSLEENEYTDDDIIVIKDELLFIKSFKIPALDSIAKSEKTLDSILLDDKNPVINPKNMIRVEFWRSPVNYKGYKMSNNKLILYGIYEFERTTIGFINNSFYLISKENYYKLENTEEFLPLVLTKKPINK
ncbi:hypothetical protein ACFLRZ_03700 [Bacteroidota bacterium]